MRGWRRVLVGLVGGVVVALAVVWVGGRSLGWFAGSPSSCDDAGAQQTVNPPRAGPAPEVDLPASAVRTIATGLCAPWGLAFLPDGTGLVTERDTTRILSVTPAGEVAEVQRPTTPPTAGSTSTTAPTPTTASPGCTSGRTPSRS
jgi:glucose/arabinose dehydrogenase